MPTHSRWLSALLIGGVGAAYLLPLLAHSLVGGLSRYMADDFCVATVARAQGLIQAEIFTYLTWSGRYSYLFLVDLASLIGPVAAQVLPAIIIVLWVAALSWSLAQLPVWPQRSRLLATLLAIVVVAATLSAVPNIVQSLYWRNSSLTYAAPLVFGSLLAGVTFRRPGHPASWLLVFGLAFFAGGFSEIYTALQFALFGLALAWVVMAAWRGRQWRAAGPWLAGWLGSAAALAAIALAPGTHARQATLAMPPNLWSLIDNSRQYAAWFFRDAVQQQTPLLLAVAASGAAVAVMSIVNGGENPKRSTWWLGIGLLILPILAYGLMIVCYAPAFYSLLYLPPDRVLIINWYLFIAAMASWGFLAGLAVGPSLVRLAGQWPKLVVVPSLFLMAILLAVPPVMAAAHTLSTWPAAWSYASTWDSDELMLTAARAHGGGTITVARLNMPGNIDSLSDDPQFWTNQCLAQYYGVQVRAVAPPPPPDPAQLNRRSPIAANIGGVAQVLGYHVDQSSVRAGEALTVTVFWNPTTNTDRPYTVFLHLYDPAAGSLGQFDGYPGNGAYPTTLWIHGQTFADNYQVPVRPAARAGMATLILGLYDLQTGQRLPVTGADAGPPGQDWVVLGHVQIEP